MLAQARMGVLRRLHWVYAEAGRTSLADVQFHLTFCVDVVHHLDNRAGVFGEAHRVLRLSGALCLATDSENIIRSREPLSVYWPETVRSRIVLSHNSAAIAFWKSVGFTDYSLSLEIFPNSRPPHDD